MVSLMSVTASFVFFLASVNEKTFAYLDPGSGSYLWQLILAAILSSLFLVKVYWKKITRFFKGDKSDNQDPGSGDDE